MMMMCQHFSQIWYGGPTPWLQFQDDIKLAQLVRAPDCLSGGRQLDSGKTPQKKTGYSNLLIDVALITS